MRFKIPFEPPAAPDCPEEFIWIARDKTAYDIRTISNRYLLNIANMILRFAPAIWERQLWDSADAMDMANGDMAKMHFEQHALMLMHTDPHEIVEMLYENVFNECVSRGLMCWINKEEHDEDDEYIEALHHLQ